MFVKISTNKKINRTPLSYCGVITDALSNYEDWSAVEKPKEFNKFIYHPKTKGRVIVINLADAVNEPAELWEKIKNKNYINASM